MTRTLYPLFIIVFFLISCSNKQALVAPVLTAEEQAALTPKKVINSLKEGNSNFTSGDSTVRDYTKQVRQAVRGQYPKAITLSCIDSRVPIEDVFDLGIGDMFVTRVAGNFANTDVIGGMEFACKVAGAKVILVLGHDYCGAVKGAIDKVELGNLTPMLENINPAVEHFHDYPGKQHSSNLEFLHMVTEQNVRMTMENIRKESKILREMEERGEIKIVGGIYDMETGRVDFIDA